MDTEITSATMQRLLGVNKVVLNDLTKRGIVKRGERKGTYDLQASVSGYCAHLRDMAAGRGGEAGASARERLGASQGDLTETKAKQETFWRTKLKAFRNRVLAIPHRVEYLSARQTLALTQELRACLDELADDKAG
jgi:terminase small subunit / prophage DNA-packing protein